MWSMPVDLTETENENDSANQNDVAKMTLWKWCCKNDAAKMMLQNDVEVLATQADGIISPNKHLI